MVGEPEARRMRQTPSSVMVFPRSVAVRLGHLRYIKIDNDGTKTPAEAWGSAKEEERRTFKKLGRKIHTHVCIPLGALS